MKGWYAKHEDKWKKILDIVDSKKPAHEGGGNMYHLEGNKQPVHQDEIEDVASPQELNKSDKLKGGLADKRKPEDFDQEQLKAGIKVEMEHTNDPDLAREIAMDHLTEDKDYYKKLKTIEKYDRVEVTADGKIELDYGSEPLDKKPSGSVSEKWDSIKKALDKDSFISINDVLSDDEEDDEEESQDGDQVQPEHSSQDGSLLRDTPSEQEEDYDESQLQDSEEELETGRQDGADGPIDEGSPEQALQALEDHLRQEGYSDHEISYIIHGHAPHQPTSDEINSDKDAKLADLDLNHHSRMKDVEHQKALFDMETNSLDREHKKRILDLEYEFLKQEKQLELEHKKKELELKLEQQRSRFEKPKSQAAVGNSRDAAKTSKSEREGNG